MRCTRMSMKQYLLVGLQVWMRSQGSCELCHSALTATLSTAYNFLMNMPFNFFATTFIKQLWPVVDPFGLSKWSSIFLRMQIRHNRVKEDANWIILRSRTLPTNTSVDALLVSLHHSLWWLFSALVISCLYLCACFHWLIQYLKNIVSWLANSTGLTVEKTYPHARFFDYHGLQGLKLGWLGRALACETNSLYYIPFQPA